MRAQSEIWVRVYRGELCGSWVRTTPKHDGNEVRYLRADLTCGECGSYDKIAHSDIGLCRQFNDYYRPVRFACMAFKEGRG